MRIRRGRRPASPVGLLLPGVARRLPRPRTLAGMVIRRDASVVSEPSQTVWSGAVTMLFTDIEGSTQLARTLGAGWPAVIRDHHRILQAAIVANGGRVERTAGDSFFALFLDAAGALRAATAAQRALIIHDWPGTGLRGRMAVHTGVVERSGPELTGLDIHLAARVERVAQGGQVVVTDAARAAAGDGFEVVALGAHRLKDFPAPETLWLLIHDERGRGRFAPLPA